MWSIFSSKVFKMVSMRSFSVLALATLLTYSCSKKEAPSQESAPAQSAVGAAAKQQDPVAEAKTIFKSRCVVCHGDTGEGNGPGSAALNPKPRSFGDPEWQAEVDDERLKQVIVGGGPAVKLSPLMPANPDLKDKPEVVAERVKVVRGFKK